LNSSTEKLKKTKNKKESRRRGVKKIEEGIICGIITIKLP
jgi:hypothetical protein